MNYEFQIVIMYMSQCHSHSEVVERVWSLAMDRDDVALTPKVLLALGAMAKRVRPSNQDLATRIVSDLHHLLEQHTGTKILNIVILVNNFLSSSQAIQCLSLSTSTDVQQSPPSHPHSLTPPCTLSFLIASLMQGRKSLSPLSNTTRHSDHYQYNMLL